MKKSVIVAIATAAALVIGGGTAYALTTNAQAPEVPALIEATATSTPMPTASGKPSPASEPLVAETPQATNPDELFIEEARDRLAGLGLATTIPNATDEQLIAAGHEACDALINQQPFNDVSVIEGEQRVQGSFLDSAAIATAGMLYFCPEINGKTL